jgi:hypothetical protein
MRALLSLSVSSSSFIALPVILIAILPFKRTALHWADETQKALEAGLAVHLLFKKLVACAPLV